MTSVVELLDLDKMLNDLLDILSNLDGRMKKLELKNHIKKRPSYLKVVGTEVPQSSISDDIKLEQVQYSLELLNKAVDGISERISNLEKKEN